MLLCVQHSSRCAPNHRFSASSPGSSSSSSPPHPPLQKKCLQPKNVLQIVARATAQQQVCSETHVLCIEIRLPLLLSSPGAMFIACASVCFFCVYVCFCVLACAFVCFCVLLCAFVCLIVLLCVQYTRNMCNIWIFVLDVYLN